MKPWPVCALLPIRLVSEANAHAHWRLRQRRAKDQRQTVGRFVRAQLPRTLPDRLVVYITRIAPCGLDSDNLAGSCKHARDGIADALGIDDRDPRVEWRYRQAYPAKGAADKYALAVLIRPRLPVDDEAAELMQRADEALTGDAA